MPLGPTVSAVGLIPVDENDLAALFYRVVALPLNVFTPHRQRLYEVSGMKVAELRFTVAASYAQHQYRQQHEEP